MLEHIRHKRAGQSPGCRRCHCRRRPCCSSGSCWRPAGTRRRSPAGVRAAGRHTGHHTFFSRARWSVCPPGKARAGMARGAVPAGGPAVYPVGDTAARHRGPNVYGKGRYGSTEFAEVRDAYRPARSHTVRPRATRGPSWPPTSPSRFTPGHGPCTCLSPRATPGPTCTRCRPAGGSRGTSPRPRGTCSPRRRAASGRWSGGTVGAGGGPRPPRLPHDAVTACRPARRRARTPLP